MTAPQRAASNSDARKRAEAHAAEIDACPLTCLNRLAPTCVIHRPSAEDGTHCIVCGLRLSTASEWCMETRDGDHRPTLPTRVIPPGSDAS